MKTVFLLLLLLGSAGRSWAQVAYVALPPKGSNAGNGTATSPYATIQYGIDHLPAGASATLIVLGGVHKLTAPLTITRPLVLRGRHHATVDGGMLPAPAAGTYRCLLHIYATSGVTVDSLTFQNCIDSGARAIWLNQGASNVTIQHCTIQNTGWRDNDLTTLPPSKATSASAIKLDGDASQALTNINILSDSVRNCAVGFGEAITLSGNIDQFWLDHNVVSRIANIGIDIKGNSTDFPGVPAALNHARNGLISYNQVSQCMSGRAKSPGIYLDGAFNCTVAGNICTQNGVGISVGSESTVPAGGEFCRLNKVYSNQVVGNVFEGMTLGAGESGATPAHPVRQLEVVNNTLWGNSTGAVINNITQLLNIDTNVSTALPTGTNGGEVVLQALNSAEFRNNILVPFQGMPALVGGSGYVVQGFASDYNCYFSAAGAYLFQLGGLSFNTSSAPVSTNLVAVFAAKTSLDNASVALAGNPGLANPAGGDFTLAASSALLNKGYLPAPLTGALALDCAGHPRVVGSRIDLGAYEYQTALAVPAPSSSTSGVYPNPATGRFWLTQAAQGRSVVVRTTLGTIVRAFQPAMASFDVAGLPPGIYLVEITPVEGTPFTQRLVLY